MTRLPPVLRFLVVAALAAPLLAQAKPRPALDIRYELVTRNTTIGQGRLLIARKPEVRSDSPDAKASKPVRAVLLQGQTENLFGGLYKGRVDALTRVDGNWQPVSARWTSQFQGRTAHTNAEFEPNRVVAHFSREGKPPVDVDKTVAGVLLDPVSLIPWLMQKKPKPGTQWTLHLYTGMDVCKTELTVRAAEPIAMAGETVQGLPIDGALSECRLKRQFTIWLNPKDFGPQRVAIRDTLLGSVDIILTSAQVATMPDDPQ